MVHGSVETLSPSVSEPLPAVAVAASCPIKIVAVAATVAYCALPAPLTATDARAGGVAKGAAVVVSCVLQTSTGALAPGANGDLLVEDLGGGPGVRPPPVVVLTVPGAFAPAGAAYAYTLDTSLAAFQSGRLYRITATWLDGSRSVAFLWVQ